MKGFTLIEILVTVLIFTLIIGGMYGVLDLTKTNYDTNLVSLNLQRQARQGMNLLSREIRQASWSSISISSGDDNNKSISFDTPDVKGVTYSVIKTIDSSKPIPIQKFWQLNRGCPKCTNRIIANDIILLKFILDPDMHIVKISLQASKTFFSFGKFRILTFPLDNLLTQQVEVRNP